MPSPPVSFPAAVFQPLEPYPYWTIIPPAHNDSRAKTKSSGGRVQRRPCEKQSPAARRAGAIHAFDSLNHFFLISQMTIPGSSYWNVGIGRAKGEVEQDEEGLKTMQTLGPNMAWLLKKTNP